MIKKIISGGQTGVDRAALDAARKNDIPTGGWCPKNGWAEDMEEKPGVMKLYPDLKETPHESVSQRTIWNVRDSDATLIIAPNKPYISRGTDLIAVAAMCFSKPYLLVKNRDNISDIAFWLNSLKPNITLNIGGPRESECEEAYEETFYILDKIIYLTQSKKRNYY